MGFFFNGSDRLRGGKHSLRPSPLFFIARLVSEHSSVGFRDVPLQSCYRSIIESDADPINYCL